MWLESSWQTGFVDDRFICAASFYLFQWLLPHSPFIVFPDLANFKRH